MNHQQSQFAGKRETRICFRPGKKEVSLLRKLKKKHGTVAAAVCQAIEAQLNHWITAAESKSLPGAAFRASRVELEPNRDLTIRISDRAALCLAREAKRSGMKVSDVVRACIRNYCEPSGAAAIIPIPLNPPRGFAALIAAQA